MFRARRAGQRILQALARRDAVKIERQDDGFHVGALDLIEAAVFGAVAFEYLLQHCLVFRVCYPRESHVPVSPQLF